VDAYGITVLASIIAHEKWVPTVVVDVNRGTDRGGEPDTSGVIARMVKPLNSDDGACRVILVLSDAYAAFSLPNDPGRQAFIWVDDFSARRSRCVFRALILKRITCRSRRVWHT
jgi:hypothetical protein